MKYAVIKVVNGNFSVDSEWNEDFNGAIVQYHGVCRTLWNEPTVETATVKIVDDKLRSIDGYTENVTHILS